MHIYVWILSFYPRIVTYICSKSMFYDQTITISQLNEIYSNTRKIFWKQVWPEKSYFFVTTFYGLATPLWVLLISHTTQTIWVSTARRQVISVIASITTKPVNIICQILGIRFSEFLSLPSIFMRILWGAETGILKIWCSWAEIIWKQISNSQFFMVTFYILLFSCYKYLCVQFLASIYQLQLATVLVLDRNCFLQ